MKLGFSVPHFLISIVLIGGIIMSRINKRLSEKLGSHSASVSNIRFFNIGAFIFLGTFLLGSNWDYRLIFLVFCIPYVLALQSEGLKYSVLLSMLLATNQIPMEVVAGQIGVAINILAKCFLFVALGAFALKRLKVGNFAN